VTSITAETGRLPAVTASIYCLWTLSMTGRASFGMHLAICSSYINTFQFSAGRRAVSVSDVVFVSGGRLFHANGPATEKLCGPKPSVVVHSTTTLTCRAQIATCID